MAETAWWPWLAGGAVALLALFGMSFMVTLIMGATRAFRPKLINGLPPFAVEAVSFRARHGVAATLTIRGWWHAGDPAYPVVLCCHGVGGNRADLNRFTARLAARGFGLLLFDFRGHGESDGWKASFGLTERWDVVAAVKFLKESGRLDPVHGERPLCLFGVSMGAASIILAAAALSRLHPLEAVVLDSSFARFAPIIRVSVREWPLLARALFLPLVTFVSNRIFQIPAFIINPIGRISRLRAARILIIHSAADELIPVTHAHRLFEHAGEPKEYWEVTGALHGEIFIVYGDEYAERISRFFLNQKSHAANA